FVDVPLRDLRAIDRQRDVRRRAGLRRLRGEANLDDVIAWRQCLWRDQVVAAEAEEVVVEARLAFPEEERPASGIAPEREDHALRAVLRNLNGHGHEEWHADQLRSTSLGKARQTGIKRHRVAAREEAGSQRDVEPFSKAVVERQNVVSRRFGHEEIL